MILGAQKRVEAPQSDDGETLRDESTEVLQGSQTALTGVSEAIPMQTRAPSRRCGCYSGPHGGYTDPDCR